MRRSPCLKYAAERDQNSDNNYLYDGAQLWCVVYMDHIQNQVTPSPPISLAFFDETNVIRSVCLDAAKAGRLLKVRFVILGDFEEETVTSSGHILDCSLFFRSLSFPLPSLPVNYDGLHNQTWILCPPSSLLVHLKSPLFNQSIKRTARQLGWELVTRRFIHVCFYI